MRFLRYFRSRRHKVTLRTLRGGDTTVSLWLGDILVLKDPDGEFGSVSLLGGRHVLLEIRAEDERITAADLELLRGAA